jgi:RHS repeat-associated protein
MPEPGRKYSAGSGYRYGFNGKENDNDVKGEGNQQDYGMRIYDPKLGKFLSVDPLTMSYPWYTPYQFAGNTPIQAIDLDGGEPKWMINDKGKLTKPMIALLTSAFNYSEEVLTKAKFVDQNLITSYSANTFFRFIFYSKQKQNYFERQEKYRTWVNQWLNLVPHEIDHVRQFNAGGNMATSVVYLFGMVFNKITTGEWYSENHILEKHPYSVVEPRINTLMNMHNGIVVKLLESTDIGDDEKIEALTFFGLEFRIDNEKNKLDKIKAKANENGRITKLETRKIKRQARLVANLSEKLEQFDKNKINALKEKLKNVPDPVYKELTEEEKKDRNENFKKG